MAEVTGAWIRRPTVVVAKITTGDHSERTDGGQRARLGAAQRGLAVPVPNHLAVQSARQVQASREWLARVGGARALVTLALSPASLVASITAALV
jgi:hypothetical protein